MTEFLKTGNHILLKRLTIQLAFEKNIPRQKSPVRGPPVNPNTAKAAYISTYRKKFAEIFQTSNHETGI